MLALTSPELDYLNQSHAFLKEGNPEKAAEFAEALYQVAPNHPDTLLLLAEINFSINNFTVGVEVLEQAINLYPALDRLFERLGYGYISLQEFDLARTVLEKAVILNSNNVSAQLFLATVLEKLEEKARAIEIYERYAESFRSAEIFSHLGSWYFDKDLSKSEKYYRLGLEIDPNSVTLQIDFAALIDSKLSTCRYLSKSDYKELLRKAKRLLNDVAPSVESLPRAYTKRYYLTLSNILGLSGEIEESISLLITLQEKQGDSDELINNIGLRYLLLKNFQIGFDYYRRAKKLSLQDLGLVAKSGSGCDAPDWNGEDLEGKHLLVTSAQGVGDQILSWAFLLDERFKNTKIILTCNKKLVKLAERSFPSFIVGADVVPLNDELIEKIDFQISVDDLCSQLFTDFSEIMPEESFLIPDSVKVQALRDKYKAVANGRPLIGVAWDSFAPTGALKSIALDDLKPILKNKSFCFVSVQYSANNDDLRSWCKQHCVDLIIDDDIDCFNDIDSSAAQLAALDSVVSISNASVHLAAAQGIPVHMLLPTKPIWHWFMDGRESIWYSKVKIYRQKNLGDWKPVVKDVLRNLKHIFQSK